MALMIIDYICFALAAWCVTYVVVFTVAATWYKEPMISNTLTNYSFLILIPAYREDKVILSTVEAAIKQSYDTNAFEVCVIADQMNSETNEKIKQLGASLLQVNFANSSKAKALNFGMSRYAKATFDYLIILDADNTVSDCYLADINRILNPNVVALQTHRMAKNSDTPTALLDAVSEEINNTIFRRGHVALKLSSALIGSGMVFNYNWFKNHVESLTTAGEDKELELLLLKEKIHIAYSDNIQVLDEKTRKDEVFYNQRRRWLAAQFGSLHVALKQLPMALRTKNIDYMDKMWQWIMPSRLMLLGGITLLAIVSCIFPNLTGTKWFILLGLYVITLLIAIPKPLINKNLFRSLLKLPYLFILMGSNLFRLRGVNKKFIHTEK